MSQSHETNRRDFLKAASMATAGVVASGVTSYANNNRVQEPKVIGANDRIRIGMIGVGGMGMAHVRSLVGQSQLRQSKPGEENNEIVAVCDVWDVNKDNAKAYVQKELNNTVKDFRDYRALLDDKDIDAVLIASPEHWHGKMAIDAIDAGKHVYLEKPLTREFEWGMKVYRKVKENPKVTFQVGVQFTTDDKWKRVNDIIKSGKLGRPIWSQSSYCRNTKEGEWNYPIKDNCKPGENLDWDMWLGHKYGLAPKRDFDPQRYFRWRKYWDYSSGINSDLFPHRLTPFMLALGAEWPIRVVATGGIYVQTDREVPDTWNVLADFPTTGTIHVAGSTTNEKGLDDLIRCQKGNIQFSGGQITITPERPYVDEVEESQEKAGGTGENITLHERNWQKCIRTGDTPNCNIDLAHKAITVVHLAEISWRQNKAVRFDPEKLRIVR